MLPPMARWLIGIDVRHPYLTACFVVDPRNTIRHNKDRRRAAGLGLSRLDSILGGLGVGLFLQGRDRIT
jgi:hypothetical protein